MIWVGAFVTAFIAAFLAATVAAAHEGPIHVVEALSHRMRIQGESVSLLLRRAAEYRILGKSNESINDLLRVVRMDPSHIGAKVELSRIYLARRDPDRARMWIGRAIATERPQAHLFAVRGDVHAAQEEFLAALKDYDRAIQSGAADVEWYLKRSSVHERLGLTDERIQGLEEGFRRTLSVVIEGEWIDALIEGGQPQLALTKIEPRLERSRLKSSWMIRRALAKLALGLCWQAEADLERAIEEIHERLHPTRSAPDLVSDLALARRLFGFARNRCRISSAGCQMPAAY